MPAKFIVRNFESESYYHIYNRGVDGRVIFQDDQDYKHLINCLERYLIPPEQIQSGASYIKGEKPSRIKRRQAMNLNGQVNVLAYCLMPNHFHFLLYQTESASISKLMRRIMTEYSMYFNKRYRRQGVLFASAYLAAKVETSMLHHLSKHIHLNPAIASTKRFGLVETVGIDPSIYPYSSYKEYISHNPSPWLNLEILNNFPVPGDYRKFIQDRTEPLDPQLIFD